EVVRAASAKGIRVIVAGQRLNVLGLQRERLIAAEALGEGGIDRDAVEEGVGRDRRVELILHHRERKRDLLPAARRRGEVVEGWREIVRVSERQTVELDRDGAGRG